MMFLTTCWLQNLHCRWVELRSNKFLKWESPYFIYSLSLSYEYRWRLKFLRQIVWESHGERTLPRDFCRLWSGIKALNTSLQFLVHNVFELRLRTSANRKIRISFSLTRETSNRKWGTLFSSTKGKRTLFSSTKGRRRDISVSSNKFSPTTTKGGRRQAGRQAWTDGKSSLWFCSSSPVSDLSCLLWQWWSNCWRKQEKRRRESDKRKRTYSHL